MTNIARMNKVYAASLKYGDNQPRKFIHELPLPPLDISVGRKTPKSKRLLEIESKAGKSKVLIGETVFIEGYYCDPTYEEMISIYRGSDLDHFKS